jgi:hypothetical protein
MDNGTLGQWTVGTNEQYDNRTIGQWDNGQWDDGRWHKGTLGQWDNGTLTGTGTMDNWTMRQ